MDGTHATRAGRMETRICDLFDDTTDVWIAFIDITLGTELAARYGCHGSQIFSYG